MKTSTLAITLVITLLSLSCGRSKTDYNEKASIEEHTAEAITGSTAASEKRKDTVHQFVRTADLKFKVKEVVKATYAIEHIVAKLDGFVTFTNLTSQVNEINETPLGNDSLLEKTRFSIVNSMIIRVPNYNLDSTLKCIAPLVDFLDYRVIKADDVSLSLLANKLSQTRNNVNQARLSNAVAQQGKKLNEITHTEEQILQRQEQNDNALISNMALKDKIQYSTITIELYQRPGVKYERVINDKNSAAFEPSFGIKIKHSIVFGWSVLETILVFLFRLWPLFLVGFIAYLLLKKFGK